MSHVGRAGGGAAGAAVRSIPILIAALVAVAPIRPAPSAGTSGHSALGASPSSSQRAVNSSRVGAQLEPGMQLVYASEGVSQPPWTIDSLQLGLSLIEGADCAVIHLRRRPSQTEPEENRFCLVSDTLYRWDARDGSWSVSRPVGRHMVWSVRRANGDVVRYETGATMQDTISGRSIPVVLTTVTTTDSLGRPTRRLRERYALSLATATGGVFESADSTMAGGWRASGTFEIREILLP